MSETDIEYLSKTDSDSVAPKPENAIQDDLSLFEENLSYCDVREEQIEMPDIKHEFPEVCC